MKRLIPFTATTGNEDLLNEGGNLAGESGLSDGSDAGQSAWSGLSSETASGNALWLLVGVLIYSSDLDGDVDVRHVEHIDGFWGPIYALVVIFMCVTAVYLVAYYIELRDQRARRQSVRLSQVVQVYICSLG